MTVLSLGGVNLPLSLQSPDRYEDPSIVQVAKRTLGGHLKLYVGSLQKGRPITLASQEDAGWIDKATVDLLQAMAQDPTGQYELRIGAEVHSVVFRHYDSPAFSASPLVYRTGVQQADLFTCTIKLLTV